MTARVEMLAVGIAGILRCDAAQIGQHDYRNMPRSQPPTYFGDISSGIPAAAASRIIASWLQNYDGRSVGHRAIEAPEHPGGGVAGYPFIADPRIDTARPQQGFKLRRIGLSGTYPTIGPPTSRAVGVAGADRYDSHVSNCLHDAAGEYCPSHQSIRYVTHF
jgi:hypothetical protein